MDLTLYTDAKHYGFMQCLAPLGRPKENEDERRYYDLSTEWFGFHANPCDLCGGKDFEEHYVDNYKNFEAVAVCKACGWWRSSTFCGRTDDIPRNFNDSVYHVVFGIHQTFDVAALKIPTETLRAEIERRFDKIIHVAPRVLEKLVASVFRDHLSCDVTLTAETKDGGIDLYAILKDDSKYLVQVKRRSSKRAESVQVVREFIGTLLIENVQRGAIVTTAKKFSEPATKAASAPTLTKLGMTLDLINYDSLNDIFPKKQDWTEFDCPENKGAAEKGATRKSRQRE